MRDRLQTLFRRSLPFLICFCAGLILGSGVHPLFSKLDMFDARTFRGRCEWLTAVLTDVGFSYFSSCENKVEELHGLIGDSGPGNEDQIRKTIASILLDGKSCNPYLLEHLNSQQRLPEFLFYRYFTNGLLNDSKIGTVLEDEQGLMLWLLARINHDRLVPSIDNCVFCEGEKSEYRNFMVDHWQFLLGDSEQTDE